MPSQLTYPGVYIEEIPSGVRTITGVATSIAAFVGWAPKGSTDRADLVLSWTDFEDKFRGLHPKSLLGYSVYHFFANGGQQAHIIRLVAEDAAKASVALDGLTLTAKNEGAWANQYGVTVKKRDDDESRFRLRVVAFAKDQTDLEDPPPTVLESFDNLSMDPADPRWVKEVVTASSAFLDVEAPEEVAEPPSETPVRLAGGEDGSVLDPQNNDFHAALTAANRGAGARLENVDLFNLLCVPGLTDAATLAGLQKVCRDHRAFLIADCGQDATFNSLQVGPGGVTGADAINSAFYFPWIKAPDPLQENRPDDFPPCGFVAGIYARTDATRGVWKAPAGTEASLSGVLEPKEPLNDPQNGILNVQAINCVRTFPVYGTVVWGARTLHGHDERGSEWKYIPVRRTALFIEESLYRGTQWAVFEPNDEPLWSQLRLNIGAFMQDLFRKGAFQGKTPKEAYFVKVDRETTTQTDINRGIVNILVGFAPLKPAEFVVIKIQQMAGNIET